METADERAAREGAEFDKRMGPPKQPSIADQLRVSEENIKSLQREIAKATIPSIREVLLAELKKEEAKVFELRAGRSPNMTRAGAVGDDDSSFELFGDDDVFPVERTGKTKDGRRFAFYNGQIHEVEKTGKKVIDGKMVPVAKLGKFAPSRVRQFEYGFEENLGGLPFKAGEAIAALRAGPGGARDLAAGRRREMGLKYPDIAGTPYEGSASKVAGGVTADLGTDPTSLLGLKWGAVPQVAMGAVQGGVGEASDEILSGHEVSGKRVAAGTGMGAGMAGMLNFVGGKVQEAGQALLKRTPPPAGKGGGGGLTFDQSQMTGGRVDVLSRSPLGEPTQWELTDPVRLGTGESSKPIKSAKQKADSSRKEPVTGHLVDPNEGNLDDVLPRLDTKVELGGSDHADIDFENIEIRELDSRRLTRRLEKNKADEAARKNQEIADRARQAEWERTGALPPVGGVKDVGELTLTGREPRIGGLPDVPGPEFPNLPPNQIGVEADGKPRLKGPPATVAEPDGIPRPAGANQPPHDRSLGGLSDTTVPELGLRPPQGRVGAEGQAAAQTEAERIQAEQYAAAKKKREAAEKRKQIDYNKDTLLDAIAKLGGLRRDMRLDLTSETKGRLQRGILHVFHKNGKDLDSMLESLYAHGYIPEEEWAKDGGKQWFERSMFEEANGYNQFHSLKADHDKLYQNERDRWNPESGKVNPALLARVGGAGAGAAAGAAANPDDRFEGAVWGAAGGGVAGHVATRVFLKGGYGGALKVALGGDNEGRKLFDQVQGRIASWERSATQTYEGLKQMRGNIPDARMPEIIRAIEANDFSKLSQEERAYAMTFSNAIGQIGTAAQQASLLGANQIRPNHVPLQFDWDNPQTAKILQQMGYTKPTGEAQRWGFNTYSPHAQQRTIDTYAKAQQLGLTPKYGNLEDIFRGYANQTVRAMENKRAIMELQNLKDGAGNPLAVSGAMATASPGQYQGWVRISDMRDVHVSDMGDFMVHPEIAESVKLGLSSYEPSIIAQSAMATAWTAKRLKVSYSLFHPMSLLQAYMGAAGAKGPLAVLDVMGGAAARGVEKATLGKVKVPYESAVDLAIKQYRTGAQNDPIEYLIRNGLQIEAGLEDRQGRELFSKVNSYLEGKGTAGKVAAVPGKVAGKIDQGFQEFTWGYMYTGMKLATAQKMFETEYLKAVKAGKQVDMNKLAADVSSYVNSTFGGLDWRRIAEDTASEKGRKALMALATPRGQAYAQIGVFAPDWTVSTLSSWTRGLGLSVDNPQLEAFHRKYLLTSAAYSLAIADAVNYKLSGHHIWDNQFHHEGRRSVGDKINDMTFVDMGNGQRMQMFKHFNEGPHAVSETGKFALNKLGMLPQAGLEAAQNRQYISPSGHAPRIIDPRLSSGEQIMGAAKWAGRKFVPIPFQGSNDLNESLLGFAGLPVYGKPNR